MTPSPKLASFVVIALVCLAGLAQCGVIDDIDNAVTAITCPMKHTQKYDTCSSVVDPFYTVQPKILDDDRKKRCCSLLALRDCTKAISFIMCGSSTNSAEVVVDSLKALALECTGLDGITDCTHPIALIIIWMLLFCIIFSILKCLCNCLFCNQRNRA